MGELFKEHPSKVAVSMVAAGVAAWFGWAWWAILLAFLGGLFLGAIVESAGDHGENETSWPL